MLFGYLLIACLLVAILLIFLSSPKKKTTHPCPSPLPSKKNSYSPPPRCRLKNNPPCIAEYQGYKKVCNQVWDRIYEINGIDGNTPNGKYLLKKYLDAAQKCKIKRIEFQKHCCNVPMDSGHLGAIKKMDKIIQLCKEKIDDQS